MRDVLYITRGDSLSAILSISLDVQGGRVQRDVVSGDLVDAACYKT